MACDRKFCADEAWFATPVTSVRAFLEIAQEEYKLMNDFFQLPSDVEEPSTSTAFAAAVECNTRTQERVFADISLDHLLDDSRPVEITFEELNTLENFRPDELKSHDASHQRMITCKNRFQKNNYMSGLKYNKFETRGLHLSHYVPSKPRCYPEDVMIMVNINVPHNRILASHETSLPRLMRPHYKFACRGDTTLLKLRERIACVSDLGAHIEPGKELEKPEHCSFQLYPSSFIFIHDTFYIDRTAENSIDTTEEIRKFMARKKASFDKPKVADMEGVRLIDLTLRLGLPYVFQHSGNCEHNIIFTDLRLMTKDDEPDAAKYPILAFERGGSMPCMACRRLDATMGVEENSRLPMTPAFFCFECFKSFHFTHGRRVGDFKAFPFFLPNRLM